MSTFGAAVDSSDNLHVVWPNTTALGALGQTSNPFYKNNEGGSWVDSVWCITPMYNVPTDLDTLHDEGFEDGVPPTNWAVESDNTCGCHQPDTYWGSWEAVGGDLPNSGSFCCLGKRFYGCGTHCWGASCQCYFVMPPFLVSAGDSLSFCFRATKPDTAGTAGLRVVGIDTFQLKNHVRFAETPRVFLWEDSLVYDTTYDEVRLCLSDSLPAGKIAFVAFELFGTSDTSVGVCIDDVCKDLPLAACPKIPRDPALCSEPSVAVDGDGNVHVAFKRDVWQPEACVCTGQIYYTKRYANGTWSTPVHVDSSGVGERSYQYARVCRQASDPVVLVDGDNKVHLAWTDVGNMNDPPPPSVADDIYYSCKAAGSADWQDSPFVVSDDGEGGAPDGLWSLGSDLAMDGSGNLICVFHGGRVGESLGDRYVPGITRIWWRKKDPVSGWSSTCATVPDPNTQAGVIICRTPSIDIDSDGNMYAAYAWRDTIDRYSPCGSALAEYVIPDSAWVSPARMIRHIHTSRSVERPVAVRADSDGDVHLVWTEVDTTAEVWTIAHMKSLPAWDSCVAPAIDPGTDEFGLLRCLCPGGDGESLEVAITVQDTSTVPVPIPRVPLYMTVENTLAPPEPCDTYPASGDPYFVFWCVAGEDIYPDDPDTLLAPDTTDVTADTTIVRKYVSGCGQLTLKLYLGSALAASTIVWFNSPDIVLGGNSCGIVDLSDISAFGTALQNWDQGAGMGTWFCDFVSTSTCTDGEQQGPLFEMELDDIAAFGMHTGHSKPDTCPSE